MPTAADLSGWPTPTAQDSVKGGQVNGRPGAMGMAETVQLQGWTTPSARDHKDTIGMATETEDGRQRLDQIPRQAAVTGWPTPTAQSPNSLRGKGQDPMVRKAQGHTVNLTDAVNFLRDVSGPVRLVDGGNVLIGASAGMESSGQLRPGHSRWVMGYPIEWDYCGATAMQSCPKSQVSSSKRSKK